jgi:LPXTG-motif cell wall-anchored protein
MSPISATVSRRTVRALLAAGLACLVSGLTVAFAALIPSASATHVVPVPKDGNLTCSDLEPEGATWLELKVPEEGDGVEEDGTFTDGTLTVNIINVEETDDGWVFDWTSNIGVDAVFVKGGNVGGNLYVYDPEATGDTGLHAPANPSGKWAGLSHISFCYDVEDETTPPTSPPPTEPTSPPPTEPTSPPPTEPTSPPPTEPTSPPPTEPTSPTMKETTPPGEDLPKTGGSGNGWLAALGAGLLLGGTGLVLAGRQAGSHQA